jgi:hydroxypyruvate isomerase
MNRREFSQRLAGVAAGHAFLRDGFDIVPSTEGFQFSVMLWTLEKQASIERSMEIVAAAGYSGIELVNEFEKWSTQDTRRMMAKMSSLKLTIDAISGGKFTLADPAASNMVLKQLALRIAVAKELGCPQLILTSGKRVDGLSQDAQRSAMVGTLKRVAELASKNNIQVVIEPIDLLENPSAYLNSVTQGFEIVRAVGSPHVAVLYDFYHEQRAGGNLIEKLEDNIDWVGLVHVADVPGRHDPGTGEIDYFNIYRTLAELKYTKYIAMEYFPMGDPVASLKTARMDALQAEHRPFSSVHAAE